MPLYDVSMQGSLVGAARHEHGIADCLSRAPLFLGSVALFFHVQEGLLLLVLGLPQHRANHNFNHLWVSGAANWVLLAVRTAVGHRSCAVLLCPFGTPL